MCSCSGQENNQVVSFVQAQFGPRINRSLEQLCIHILMVCAIQPLDILRKKGSGKYAGGRSTFILL